MSFPRCAVLLRSRFLSQEFDGDFHVHVFDTSRANINHDRHIQQLWAFLRQPSIVLYVVDDYNREAWAGYFEPDNDPAELSQTPMFRRIGRYRQNYYAFFRLRTYGSNEADYHLARRVLDVILNYE